MCGIAGVISADTSLINEVRLNAMAQALEHRGPDGQNVWKNQKGNAGFGFRRLSIIDLSERGSQPMHYQDRYTIVYNGEIYNYIELKNDLQKEGYKFFSESDTEVILSMYAKYQHDCVKYFDGMFAFAIWDETEQTLFAARDRFGEKPFFYKWDESANTFYFASEIKALWAAGLEKKVDDKMFFQFIASGYTQNPIDAGETFFPGIKKLPAHSFLVYKFPSAEISISSYWDIDLNRKIFLSESEAMEKFKELFTTSVLKRLRSDVVVGTSLSGGLDSSSIVATIQAINKKSFSTFSAVFDGFEKDESKYIRLVTEKFDVKNLQVTPTVDGFIDDLEKLSYYQEEPFTSSSSYAQYKVYELAKLNSVKVLLDGQGADETLAGYTKYYHWYWQELLRTKDFSAFNKERKNTNSNSEWSYKNYVAAFFPNATSKALKNKALKSQQHQTDISKDFFAKNFDTNFISKPVVKTLNDILYFNIFQSGLEELLRFADRNSMANGVEVRLPFLSHELVEFIFSLPSSYKIQQGFTKWILRKSMSNILPSEIVWRRDKVGFEPPQKQWMQNKKLQELIHESKKKLVSKGILNPASLQKKINPSDAYDAENADWRYLSAAQIL